MTEYLITISSSRYRLLKTTERVFDGDPESVRLRAIGRLARQRSSYIGGDDWDTWTVSVLGNGTFAPPIVARGTAEDL